jgi:hypothetical protein
MKPIPKKITKSFLFTEFQKLGYTEKFLRKFINEYMVLLGKDIRNRNVPKLIFYYLVIKECVPIGYELNNNELNDFLKLGYTIKYNLYYFECVKI